MAIHETWVLAPPADSITPAVARRWLHRSYAPLAGLSSMVAYPNAILTVRGVGLRQQEREHALRGMSLIASDVRRITVACGKALATGRTVPMQHNLDALSNHRGLAAKLRAVLKYERRHPHRGTRAILQRALAAQEHLAKSQSRSWTTR